MLAPAAMAMHWTTSYTITQILLFVQRDVFWKLAQLLEERGAERGANTWHQGIGPGYEPRPIYQQIAAALLVLSDNGSSTELLDFRI